MKKYVLLTSILAICLLCTFGCQKTSSLKKVTLNEVAHSIFYAPQYVAIELGYFEEEGIDLSVETGFGADKTMTAVISGDADIGFMGPEATIYQYQEGNRDYAVNFAQLTQRAGNFLISRENVKDFHGLIFSEKMSSADEKVPANAACKLTSDGGQQHIHSHLSNMDSDSFYSIKNGSTRLHPY